MKCEICEKDKHCIALDVEWTLLDQVCEDCFEKYLVNGYVDYDRINEDKENNGEWKVMATRGKLAYITNNGEIFTSREFNGDMMVEGHGNSVIDGLNNVDSLKQFHKMVKQFNENNFQYSYGHEVLLLEENYLNFEADTYFETWYSDYVYIKNNCEYEISIKDFDGKNEKLPSGKVTVLNFGEIILSQ